MKAPFLDPKEQYHSIRKEIAPSILNILEISSFVPCKSVSDFEGSFASALGAKHCIGVSSGTDGNCLALWALGIKTGDDVLVAASTFIAMSLGATLGGATPVLVDCDPESYNIHPERVKASITPRTKAIVAAHLYGQAADLAPSPRWQKSTTSFLLKMRLRRILQSTMVKRIKMIRDHGATQKHVCEIFGQDYGME
jgi:dTDP-4-amino-4,6-dideoxygalactose transaminase